MEAMALNAPEVRATKEKLAALAALSEKPKRGKKVAVHAHQERGAGGPRQLLERIRQNFGPNPDKANTNLSEEEKKPLLNGVGKEGGGKDGSYGVERA